MTTETDVWASLIYSSRIEYSHPLKINKTHVEKAGVVYPKQLMIELQSVSSHAKLSIRLFPQLAIPLARDILNVAEGYASKSESEIA